MEILKKLAELIDSGERVLYLGECHFYQHGTRMRVWIPPEDINPTVLQEPGRKGISIFGAISLSDDRLITGITEGYNAFTFLEFLSIVHKKFPDSVFVLDNALYHHASIVTDYAFLSQIDLLFMSPYSPELNPIEFIWKSIKRIILKSFIDSRESMCNLIENAFLSLSKLKSYTKSWISRFLPLDVQSVING